jgi:hypothetical protein
VRGVIAKDPFRKLRHYGDAAQLQIYCSTTRFTPKVFFTSVDDLNFMGECFGTAFSGFGRKDPTTHILTEADQRRICSGLGEWLQAYMRVQSGLRDVVE